MMITPNNRREFERHIHIMSEKIQRRTFRLPPDRSLLNMLLDAKQLPNNRVNFLTINDSVRLMANSLVNFDRPEFKMKQNAEE